MLSLNNDSVYKTQCPSKNCLNGYLYNAVLEKFSSSIYPAVGRAGWIAEWKMMCDVFAAVSVVLQHTGLQLQIV